MLGFDDEREANDALDVGDLLDVDDADTMLKLHALSALGEGGGGCAGHAGYLEQRRGRRNCACGDGTLGGGGGNHADNSAAENDELRAKGLQGELQTYEGGSPGGVPPSSSPAEPYGHLVRTSNQRQVRTGPRRAALSDTLRRVDSAADVLTISPVIPVVEIADERTAISLGKALVRGGIRIIEITLRTPGALAAIRAVVAEVPDLTVGAGTILTGAQAEAAITAGATFLVTPGSPPALMHALAGMPVAVLPGASTLTEMLTLVELGYTDVKFFPAQASGGIPWLKAMHAPLPHVQVYPTGGITPELARDYLALPHVPCVGGSWLTTKAALSAGDWAGVEVAAREASTLATS